MFTGLIREIGVLRRIEARAGVLRLVIGAPETAARIGVGDSVAVGGICLTAESVGNGGFTVAAAQETQRLTTLSSWRPGRRLHLEPALRLGEAFDGHWVQGHVDGTGTVKALRRAAGGWFLTVDYPRSLGRYLRPKGSIAVDGVSLTLDQGPFSGTFTVNLIPHTMDRTTFRDLRPGDNVNLEMDAMVKAVLQGGWATTAKAAGPVTPAAGLSLQRLLAAGFGKTTKRGRS